MSIVCSFLGFFNKDTAYAPGRIFTQNTSNDVVPGKEVPLGVPMTIFYIWTFKFPKKSPFSGPILTGQFLATENRFNMGMLRYKLPVIVIVAP